MKKTPSLLLLILLILAPSLSAQDILDKPYIRVNGTAEIHVDADEMHWSVTVTAKADSISEAATMHSENLRDTLKLLDQQHVKDRYIKTSRLQLKKAYTYNRSERKFDGYLASVNVSFKSFDLDRYEAIWEGIAGLGYIEVNNVYFDYSKRIEKQEEARAQALRAARDKAIKMSRELDRDIGKPLLIQEDVEATEGYQPYANLMSNSATYSGEGASQVNGAAIAGQITVTQRVQVYFELRDR